MIIERPPLYEHIEVMDYVDILIVGPGIPWAVGTILQLLTLEFVQARWCHFGDVHGNITLHVHWDDELGWLADHAGRSAQIILSKSEDQSVRDPYGNK